MLVRNIEKEILKWLKEDNKALLVEGARQVGKTFTIKKVLKENNLNFYELNLIENPSLKSIFETTYDSSENFISYLSLIGGKQIRKGSIIFIDEVQEAKEFLTYIKFLALNENYKFILSGSLLGVEITNLRSAPVGYLEILTMYPLDFEEFCINYGVPQEVLNVLELNFTNLTEINETIHEKMIQIFKNYLLVGGMPQIVSAYLKNKEFYEIEKIQKNIIELYKLDFTKYENNSKLRLRKIYDMLSVELSEQNRKFIFSDIEKNGRYSKYENSFNWLIDAGVALPTYNLKEPRLPLRINLDNTSFKLFMSDVGLLTYTYGDATKKAILLGTNSLNAGAIYENFVAQELKAHNYDSFYFTNRRLGEIDFVIEYEDYILPIEVKSGKDYRRHSALNNLLTNETYKINKALVLSNNNLKVIDSIIYLPIYMTMFIKRKRNFIKLFNVNFD